MKTNSSQIKLLEKELSYKVCGILIEISKKYGNLYKEEFYHNACREKFELTKTDFISQPKINVLSIDSGKKLSTYIPDFLIENKLIVELKALPFLPNVAVNQLDQYLKASKYEVGYIVNFGTPRAEIIRRIYTNDLKPWLK